MCGPRSRGGEGGPAGRVRERGPATVAIARPPACQRVLELCRHGFGGATAEVILHVRGDGCTMDDGSPVAESVAVRIAPTAFLRALIH